MGGGDVGKPSLSNSVGGVTSGRKREPTYWLQLVFYRLCHISFPGTSGIFECHLQRAGAQGSYVWRGQVEEFATSVGTCDTLGCDDGYMHVLRGNHIAES